MGIGGGIIKFVILKTIFGNNFALGKFLQLIYFGGDVKIYVLLRFYSILCYHC